MHTEAAVISAPWTTDAVIGLVSPDTELLELVGGPLRDRGVRVIAGAMHATVGRLLALAGGSLCVVDARSESDELMLYVQEQSDGRPGRLHCAYRPQGVDVLVKDLTRLLRGRRVATPDALEAIRGRSPGIELVREQIRSVSKFRDVSVLILGETGTGKELVARALHDVTFGSEAPFVAVNCAAIPENLLESELFGHEAGSYTGARGAKAGLLEAAAGGTIFLDEIGEMPPSLQAKLLRVLESREFRRIGSNRSRPLEARVLSATNQEPWAPANCRLRSDVVYRLAGFTVRLPPLRERPGDLEILVRHFLTAFERRYDTPLLEITPRAMDLLHAHDWPGNIRELRATLEHAAIVAQGAILPDDVRSALAAHRHFEADTPAGTTKREDDGAAVGNSLRAIERRVILRALDDNEGNVSRTARQLGIPRSTLRSKLERLEAEN